MLHPSHRPLLLLILLLLGAATLAGLRLLSLTDKHQPDSYEAGWSPQVDPE